MQSVSSRFWTCVAVSISYDDNHYTTGTALIMLNLVEHDLWLHICKGDCPFIYV